MAAEMQAEKAAAAKGESAKVTNCFCVESIASSIARAEQVSVHHQEVAVEVGAAKRRNQSFLKS